jgi:hypothetical protein
MQGITQENLSREGLKWLLPLLAFFLLMPPEFEHPIEARQEAGTDKASVPVIWPCLAWPRAKDGNAREADIAVMTPSRTDSLARSGQPTRSESA